MREKTREMIIDILERAVKTFLQAFMSAFSVDVLLGVTDFDAMKKVGLSMLVAALAAGISAVWNGAVKSFGGDAA